MKHEAAGLIALVMAACSSSSGGSGGGSLSQQVVWPISDQVNVLGNNLQIDVSNLYGYTVSGLTPLADVETLAKTVNGALTSLSTSVCAGDPKAADAASASQALLTFIQGLPPGGGSSSDLNAQVSKEEQLSAALRSAITASSCISQLTPPSGSTSPPGGAAVSSEVAITGASGSSSPGSVAIPVQTAQAFPAIAVANLGANGLSIGSITLDYVDGTTRTIGFGSSPGDGTSTQTALSAQLGGGASLVVDVDARVLKNVTLVGASLACPAPPGSGGGGAVPCNSSVKIVGLTKGNGLSP